MKIRVEISLCLLLAACVSAGAMAVSAEHLESQAAVHPVHRNHASVFRRNHRKHAAKPVQVPASQLAMHTRVAQGGSRHRLRADGRSGSSGRKRAKVVKYGPQNCVRTWRSNKKGTCWVKTKCEGVDTNGFNFAVVCMKKGEAVLHQFGQRSFAPKEKFDTLIECDKCLAPPGTEKLTAAPTTPAPVAVTATTTPAALQTAGTPLEKAAALKMEIQKLTGVVVGLSSDLQKLNTAVFKAPIAPPPGVSFLDQTKRSNVQQSGEHDKDDIGREDDEEYEDDEEDEEDAHEARAREEEERGQEFDDVRDDEDRWSDDDDARETAADHAAKKGEHDEGSEGHEFNSDTIEDDQGHDDAATGEDSHGHEYDSRREEDQEDGEDYYDD